MHMSILHLNIMREQHSCMKQPITSQTTDKDGTYTLILFNAVTAKKIQLSTVVNSPAAPEVKEGTNQNPIIFKAHFLMQRYRLSQLLMTCYHILAHNHSFKFSILRLTFRSP